MAQYSLVGALRTHTWHTLTVSESSGKNSALRSILTQNGSQHGWLGFEQLCSEGCDPILLTWFFLWLYDEPVRVKGSDTGTGRFEMRPTPLDSSAARGDYTLEALDRIANLAREFPLIASLAASSIILLGTSCGQSREDARLGHASIALTLDVYTHVLPDMQKAAAQKLENLLFRSTGTL